ncbi:MAG: diguanylate cyclase [Syntrophobacteraceae bacterium]
MTFMNEASNNGVQAGPFNLAYGELHAWKSVDEFQRLPAGMPDGVLDGEWAQPRRSECGLKSSSRQEWDGFASETTSPEEENTPRMKLEIAIFADLVRALTSTLDLSEILQIITQKVTELLAPQNWSLLLMEPDAEHLQFELVVGEGEEILTGRRLRVDAGIAGWVARSGKGIIVRDVSKDPRFCSRFDTLLCFETCSVICVPLINRGRVLGVLELVNRLEQGPFTSRDMHSLQTIAEYAAIAISNSHLYRDVRRLSMIDDHTSLFNIRHLHDALDSELRTADERGGKVCMIFFDLDRFKSVVDRHGHFLASKVLREVGILLRELVRPQDIPVRYGGDEFVIVMPGTGKEEALEFAEYIREKLKSKLFLSCEGINLGITASFGVASYPGDAKNKSELLRFADTAMYRIKESSRDSVGSV